MGEKHRPGARPSRAGKGPKSNPPRGGAGQNKPNTGAKTGGTGKGTQHKTGGQPRKGCGKKSIVAMPFIVLAVLFYALPRLAFDTWRERRR